MVMVIDPEGGPPQQLFGHPRFEELRAAAWAARGSDFGQEFLFGWLPTIIGGLFGWGIAAFGTATQRIMAGVIAAAIMSHPEGKQFGAAMMGGLLLPALAGPPAAQLGAGAAAAATAFVAGPVSIPGAPGIPWGILGLISPLAGFGFWATGLLFPGVGHDPVAAAGAAGGLMLQGPTAYWRGFGAGALISIILIELLD